ncbi:MAG: hypothetical protein CM1200mP14_01500 [Gammaproteobacteria bacterium]|nr:MAG: hypothetical protein CM1200mP14_01500 [Gammaproteobacteria bacterium]
MGTNCTCRGQAFFERQVNGLLAGGVDGFILETFADLNEIDCAFTASGS